MTASTSISQGCFFCLSGCTRSKGDVLKPRDVFLPLEAKFIVSKIEKVDPDAKKVVLHTGTLDYDLLIIASGSRIAPSENEGLLGPHWQKSIFDFYTLDGALKLQRALRSFKGGRLVLNVAEMPVKCPVPPEFVMLADWLFHERGMRDKVEVNHERGTTHGEALRPGAEARRHLIHGQRDVAPS